MLAKAANELKLIEPESQGFNLKIENFSSQNQIENGFCIRVI